MNERKITLFTNPSGRIEVSDGYHTFSELYDHRQILFIKLCKFIRQTQFWMKRYPGNDPEALENSDIKMWKSRLHSDGSMFEGMFIAGVTFPDGKHATYHIDETRWYLCDHFPELINAPERDSHTSVDVLSMLITL